MGGQRKGGLPLFYRFIVPELHGRKTKNRNQRSLMHVGGGGVSVPRQKPRSFGYRLPGLDTPDGEINLSAAGGGAGTDPRVSGAQQGPPRVTGRRATSGGPGSPRTRGADFIFHAAPISLAPLSL